MNYLYGYFRVVYIVGFVLFYILFGKKSPQQFYQELYNKAFPFGQFLIENKERFDMIRKENKNGKGCVIMANHSGVFDVCFIERFVECYIIVKNDLCGELVNEEDDGIQNYLRKKYFDKCLLISYKRGNKESLRERLQKERMY